MKKLLTVLGLISSFFAMPARAATSVSWTAAQMDATASGLSTSGTLKYAYTAATSALTVNGITFSSWGGVTGNSDVGIAVPSGVSYSAQYTNGGDEGVSGDYGTLLTSSYYYNAKGDYTITLNNLTVGKSYLFQLFIHYNNGNPELTVKDYSPETTVRPHVSWSDTEWKYGGVLTGAFTASATSESFVFTYSSDTPGTFAAMQLREVSDSSGGGTTPTVVAPSVSSAAASVSGSTATISLTGVTMGTDDEGTAATSYSVSYSLNGGTSVDNVLTSQTGSSASFAIADLADGTYTCTVTVTTSAGKTATATTTSFTISTSSSGGGSSGTTTGWTVSPMDSTGSTIITDGDSVYAASIQGGTVNGVSFTRTIPVTAPDDKSVVASPAASGSRYGDYGTASVSDSTYGQLLSHASYWTSPTAVTLTFNGLTIGNTYKIQLVSHGNSSAITISAGGTTPQPIKDVNGDTTYKYGASLVGTFKATAATYSVTVTFTGSGEGVINAIQLRDLGVVGPTVVEPEIGAVTTDYNGSVATVSLTDIEIGTDDDGTNATSYAVLYKLGTDGETVTAKEGESASAVDFEISGLAAGVYTGTVWIVSSAEKTSATKSFVVDTRPVAAAPAIGTISAAVSGGTATISISGVKLGTNEDGTEYASSYAIAYSLGSGATSVATGVTEKSYEFAITGLESGVYTCTVTITTDKNRTASNAVTFRVRSSGPVSGDALRISEICPKPTSLDPNGLESGWVELWNCGTSDVDLADYEIVRANRGKALSSKGKNLKSRVVHPGDYTVVYMSEEYDNADTGKTKVYTNDVMVCPYKISPKKFPMVALYKGGTLLEKFIVPVDLPDNASIAPAGGEFADYAGATVESAEVVTNLCRYGILDATKVSRVILTNVTLAAENDRTGETPYGPNAGPLYGVKHDYSDLQAIAPAKAATDYTVTLAINPMSDSEEGDIVSVKLLYRNDYLNPNQLGQVENVMSVPMTKGEFVEGQGQLWTGVIPAADVPAAGLLLRWAAQVTDAAGNIWRTPSFRNPDDGYEWYGTIVEPTADQVSATLPTWHLFVDDRFADMDRQYDSLSSEALVRWPYGVRCGIYDGQTSNYYDNVRIDVRGNTTVDVLSTAGGRKFSHGLRFSKAKPMKCTDPFSGEKIEVRKTSLLAEIQDPSNIRSDLSMHLRRAAGQDVPFGYPIRVQRNGEFYHLDHHTNRYTDEYLTDYLGLDEKGYSVKNCGTVGGDRDTGGNPYQVLPEDGTDIMDYYYETFETPLNGGAQFVHNNGRLAEASTNAVIRLYDLPRWFNFLALSRLTQECDDDTSSLNVYFDVNGNGTWRPMAYDLHQSFGVFWAGTDTSQNKNGLISTNDTSKCHPFHGGLHAPQNLQMGNRAYEGIYQTPKFRRLLVRRLRTLMDEILKEPGTSKEDTPFWRDYVEPMYTAMLADSNLDRAKWPLQKAFPLYVWSAESMTFREGIDDLWDNYIVPRRNHFYVTHSITNTAKTVGYGTDLNAGIPLAQSPLAELKGQFSVEAVEGGVVVRNANAETVDMSGWKLTGPVKYTFPAGSVIDEAEGGVPGEIYVVTNRIVYVAALEESGTALTDQVILGNAKADEATSFRLEDANEDVVIGDETFYTGVYDEPVYLTADDKYVFSNATLNAGLVVSPGVTVKLHSETNTVNVISSIAAAEAEVHFTGEGTLRMTGFGTLATVSNLVVKSGTLEVRSTGVAVTKTPVINVLGFAEQTGGTIDIDLDVTTTNQIYGLYIANKDPKDEVTGKALGLVYATFDGGALNAKIGGHKSAAVYVAKGSVDATFKGGETVTAELVGPEARVVNASGDLYFKKCLATVTMPDDVTGLVSNRVFKSDKDISISGEGHYVVNVPGEDSEVFSAGEGSITVDGGTFELVASDDAFSALENITVNGGLFYCVSLENDVFDSNGDMEVNGGTILAYTAAEGHEAFDVDPEQTEEGTAAHQLRINGGVIFATGGKGADWPDDMVTTNQDVYVAEDLSAGTYSEQYLSVTTAGGVVYTAKLPALSGKCAVIATCPDRTSAAPTVSATAPATGGQDFHDYYISEPVLTHQGELRFLEVYGSTLTNATDDTGDTGEYIVLTNVSAKLVSLRGLVVSSAKYDATFAAAEDPKLLVTLESGEVAAYGSVRLDMADYPWNKKTSTGWKKITNGSILLKLVDSDGATVQTAYASFDNDKYPNVDGLGAALVAVSFATELADTTDCWRSSAADAPVPEPGFTDWPDDPDTAITNGMTAAELGITAGDFADASAAELRKLAKWAKANDVPYAGADVNAMAFDPPSDFTKAYLLNCAPDAVATAEGSFTFLSITPGVVPSIEGTYNGTINYYGSTDLKAWSTPATTAHNFFKATLTR